MFTLEWNDTEQRVAQEWIQRDSLTGRVGRCCRCCPFYCYKRTCVVCLYIVFTFTTILTIGLLVAVSLGVVAPYWDTLNYEQTTCVTLRTTFNGSHAAGCICGKGCRSTSRYYPCLHIYVQYKTLGGDTVEAMLYDSEYETTCTYEPRCEVPHDWSQTQIDEYGRVYGQVDANFTCLYDPQGSGHVIRTRYTDDTRVLHVLLWPSLFIVLAVSGGVLTYLTCGCRYIWLVKPPEEIQQEAAMRLPEIYRFRADSSYSPLEEASVG